MQIRKSTLQASLVRLGPLRICLGGRGILQRFSGCERSRASTGKGFYLHPRRFWVISDAIACLHGRRNLVRHRGSRRMIR